MRKRGIIKKSRTEKEKTTKNTRDTLEKTSDTLEKIRDALEKKEIYWKKLGIHLQEIKKSIKFANANDQTQI